MKRLDLAIEERDSTRGLGFADLRWRGRPVIATSVHGELVTIWLSTDPDSEPIDVPVTELFVVGEWSVPDGDTARLTLPGCF